MLFSHACVLTTLALTLPLHQGRAQDAPSGDEILSRMRSAIGKNTAGSGARRLRGSARWEGLDGVGSFVEELGSGRRARSSTSFPGFGEFERGSDGELVWETAPGRVTVKHGWEACAELRRMALADLANWNDSYLAARLDGEEEIEGRACYRVALIPRSLLESCADGSPKPDFWYVDQESHLPRRVDIHNQEVRHARIHLADWRAVDGKRYPHRRRVEVNGFVLALEVNSIEHGVELNADHFAASEEVRAAARAGSDALGEPEDGPPAIELETLEEVHIASVRVTCTAAELQKTFAVILPEAYTYVVAAGLDVGGHVLVRYHSMGDEMDVEGGVIVSAAVEGEGRVKPSTLPAGLTAITWHIGPYHTLSQTHERLAAWMEEHQLEPNGAPWEEYWTDPGMEPDSSKWRTRVLAPVARR